MARFCAAAFVALALGVFIAGPALADSGGDGVRIRTLSNRADLVSSGDALVEVRLGEDRRAADLVLRLNGADVTNQFTYQRDQRRLLGVLKGLVEGSNKLTVHARRGDDRKGRDDDRDHGRGKDRLLSSLTITNHSRGGPVFSGPQMQPWICATVAGTPVTVTIPGTTLTAQVTTRVSGLDAEVTDAKCNAPSKFSYYYQPKAKQGSDCTFTINPGTATAPLNPCFVALNPAAPPASADIADFTNDRGVTVKSIVRVERGTMNRGIYEIVSFYDPAKAVAGALPVGWDSRGGRDGDDDDDDDDRYHRRNAPAPAPSAHDGWNGKLLWMFGASAAAHKLQAPTTLNTIFNDAALRRGYMVASASLNNNGTNANHVLAAESLMMVKEHIAEQYGRIRYTIGNGCSGGSIQQHTIASTYPGLLDGIQPNCSYQDQANIEMEIKDCGLLAGNYFVTGAGATLSPAKRAAIGGQLNPGFCQVWVPSFVPAYDPKRSTNCGPGFPAALTYDPVARKDGVRCTIPDHEAVRLGTFIDADGVRKANNTFDNTGVQYGLKALRSGAISAEEFVQLNEGVGSYSSDLVWSGPAAAGGRAARIGAQASVVANLYYTGVSGDARFLEDVAIIDLRGDQNPNGDIHANWRSWAMRDRLNAANGHHDNQVIWAFTPGLAPGAALARLSFLTMDEWLADVEADRSNRRSRAEKVVANRPVAARDWCLSTNGATEAQLSEFIGLDTPACPVKYQASPRQVAGGPLTEDVFKCALKPLNFSDPDYATLDAAQRVRLAAVFPAGVCDWSQPGVGKQTSPGWMTFASGSPVPLPRSPRSFSRD